MADSDYILNGIQTAFRDPNKQRVAAPKRKLSDDVKPVESNRPSSSGSANSMHSDQFEKRLPRSKYDVTNIRFGNLIARYPNGRAKRGKLVIRCDCDCGKKVDVLLERLLDGRTRSCGCLRATIIANKQETKLILRDEAKLSLIRSVIEAHTDELNLPTAERSEGCEISNHPDISTHVPIATESTSLTQQAVSEQLQGYLGPHQELDEDELDYESWLANLKNPNK